MDAKTLFFYLFFALGLINLLHIGFYLIGANIYDMKEYRRRAKLPKRKRWHPTVSVVIPAHNEEQGIIRCLESVIKSRHRKLQIIVVNDASTDNTKRLVRQFIAEHPKKDITLISKRKNVGKGPALNTALRRKARGEFVMTLDADSVLDKLAISNAVAYFRDPKVAGVAANVRIMPQRSILGMMQMFEHMVGYRSKKSYSISNSEFVIGGVASTYRRRILQKVRYYDTDTITEDIGLSLKVAALGNKEHRLIYAANVVAQTEGVQSYKALFAQRFRWKLGSLQNLHKHRKLALSRGRRLSKMLTWYRLPMAMLGEVLLLVEPIMFGYLLYVSLGHRTAALFMSAYLTITIYVLLTIWPDEHATVKSKLKLSLYAPFLYFVFYIMSIVQIVSIVRCLFNTPKIRRKGVVGTWVSPKRATA